MKEALRKTITMVTHDLITDPPIFYEAYPFSGDVWQCHLCMEGIPVVDETTITDQTKEEASKDFPHSGTCPVVLARHIEEMLGGEPE